MRTQLYRFNLSDPGDVGPLHEAIAAGQLDPARIVAVIGKTPGNGLVNDYTRGYVTQSLALLIGESTGEPWRAVTERVPLVFSGGTEGVLTPHFTVFSVEDEPAARGEQASLAVATAFTPVLGPGEIGREGQARATAEAVRRAMASARIEPEDVHFVQVKGPCLTAAAISEARGRGITVAGKTPEKSMAYSRVASAFGVARALGELDADAAVEAAMLHDFSRYSAVASCSSGVEVAANEIIVLGNSRHWHGPLRIAHRTMADALDIQAVVQVLGDLGLSASPQLPASERDRLAGVFVKCEPDRCGAVRGQPHTMLNDGDMNAQRHIRGAVGALVAGVTGETRLFVSGGAEHQGPDGGGLVAAIAAARAA